MEAGGGGRRSALLLHFLQGAEEVAGVAVLVGVGDELGIELLVAGLVDAAGFLVLLLCDG